MCCLIDYKKIKKSLLMLWLGFGCMILCNPKSHSLSHLHELLCALRYTLSLLILKVLCSEALHIRKVCCHDYFCDNRFIKCHLQLLVWSIVSPKQGILPHCSERSYDHNYMAVDASAWSLLVASSLTKKAATLLQAVKLNLPLPSRQRHIYQSSSQQDYCRVWNMHEEELISSELIKE